MIFKEIYSIIHSPFKSVEETPATPESTQPTEQPKEIINEPNNNSNNIKNDKIWTKLIPGLKN